MLHGAEVLIHTPFCSVILRVLGTVLGGVAGIVVWEITRGNPYGLSVLMFFAMMPLYYVFFTSQIMNIVAIMTQITLILVVIMEYTYVVSGAPTFDSVEVVAGKVCIRPCMAYYTRKI